MCHKDAKVYEGFGKVVVTLQDEAAKFTTKTKKTVCKQTIIKKIKKEVESKETSFTYSSQKTSKLL